MENLDGTEEIVRESNPESVTITGCTIDMTNKVNEHTAKAVQALAGAATANANAIAAIAKALTPGDASHYGIYLTRG